MSEAVKADALLPEQRAELEEIRAVVMAGHSLGTANAAWLVDLVDRVAALVAAAEERGFDRGVREAGCGPALAAVRAEAEWRGAEKEREQGKPGRLVDELADFGIDQHDLRLIAEALYEDDDLSREPINPALLGRLRSHLRSLADAIEEES